jgi:hypothetical protein
VRKRPQRFLLIVSRGTPFERWNVLMGRSGCKCVRVVDARTATTNRDDESHPPRRRQKRARSARCSPVMVSKGSTSVRQRGISHEIRECARRRAMALCAHGASASRRCVPGVRKQCSAPGNFAEEKEPWRGRFTELRRSVPPARGIAACRRWRVLDPVHRVVITPEGIRSASVLTHRASSACEEQAASAPSVHGGTIPPPGVRPGRTGGACPMISA